MIFFSKTFKKKLETVRVRSGVATLASEYDCLNSCSFRDKTFFKIFSKFLKNIEDLNHFVGN